MKGIQERLMGARWFPPAVAVVVVTAVVILFAWPVLFDGRTIFHTHGDWPPTDETSIHLPLHVEIARQAGQGDFAVYNPWPAFGQSLAADPDALVFDPFMVLFRGLGTPSDVLSARAVVFAFIGAFAVFGFLGLYGAPILGSAVGSAVYAALVLRFPPAEEVLVHYAATSWSMLGLFLLALAVRTRRGWAFPLAGLATGFSALAGHPQAAYFGLALGILYIIGAGWSRRGRGARHVFAGGGGWLAVALLVASVQLVPLAAAIRSSAHVFADAAHPETDENLFGYAMTLLGPGAAVLLLAPLRRRWLEIGVFVLLVLFALTIMNTPLVRLWHAVVPFFDNFKLSSKYFVSPFPILAAVGLGLAIANVSSWQGMAGRIGLLACCVCALWAVWAAPFSTIYRLQQPASVVGALDRRCVEDIAAATPAMGRIVRLDTEALYPSLSVNARLFDVQTAASHIPERYAALMMAMAPEHADVVREDSFVMSLTEPAVLELAFWDVAGVTTLVSGRPVDIPGWELVTARPDSTCMYAKKGYWIYRNAQALPRAFTVMDPGSTDGGRAGLERVLSPATPAPETPVGNTVLNKYRPTDVVIDVREPHAPWLVMTDYLEDGWKAYVDGRPAGIGRTWFLFRAVAVPEGDHTVEFRYEPASLPVGLAAGCAGVAAAVLWLVTAVSARLSARRKFRGQGSSGTQGSARQGT